MAYTPDQMFAGFKAVVITFLALAEEEDLIAEN